MTIKNKTFLLFSSLIILNSVFWLWLINSRNTEINTSEIASEEQGKQISAISFTPEQLLKYGILIQEAGPGNISSFIIARGKIVLQPDCLAHVLPKVPGVVKETYKNIGDNVEKGELLAIVESREIADAKASFLASIEREKLARSLMDREIRLREKEISSGQEVINAKSANEEAIINRHLAKQKLNALGISDYEIGKLTNQLEPELGIYKIHAPIDGTVIFRHITKGEYLESTNTIYEIADLNHVLVEIGIYPKDLSKARIGQTIQIFRPYENEPTEAKIQYISPIVDDDTINSKAIAMLENSHGNWHPGTFVKIEIPTEEKKALVVIPKDAYQEIDGKPYVFVQSPEGFEKRLIQMGKCGCDNIEIISGLNPGEKFAAANTFLLKADLGKSEVEDDD